MATERLNLRNYLKIFSSEAIRGIKLDFCRNVYNASLYKIAFFNAGMYFRCYGNLNFPLTYNGKSENWALLLAHCRYFDKMFTEMFPE